MNNVTGFDAKDSKAARGQWEILEERDATLVRYVLDHVAMPIGVSNYELSQALPNELKSDLPSIEELEAELDGAESSRGGEASEGSRERED